MDGAGFVEDFLVDVIGPVRSYGRDYEGLEFDVAEDEGAVHGEAGGGGGFAVEIAGGGEVVEGGFEGDFVVGARGLLVGKRWRGRQNGAYAS